MVWHFQTLQNATSPLLDQSRRCAVHPSVSHVASADTCRDNSSFITNTFLAPTLRIAPPLTATLGLLEREGECFRVFLEKDRERERREMNFRGGCCIARYGGGAYDMSKVDRIMLRFRPIAPRPAVGGSTTPPDKNVSAKVSSKSGRGRRKVTKEGSNSSGSANSNGNGKRCNKRRREKPKDGGSNGRCGRGTTTDVVTLPLLPEIPEKKDSPAPETVSVLNFQLSTTPFWLSFGGGRSDGCYQTATAPSAPTETVTSCVTVECITDTWVEGQYELGCTDEERKMNLEKDTCPGFISDGLGRVTWTNGPYRDLVMRNKGDRNAEITVLLVMKERPLLTHPAFTCRVRLQYTCGRNREKCSIITSPCDVWRMNGGRFAWRLDVNAALCLGR
ncbi:PREDICTED: uncharacterized protein LOC104825007 [Tarenaya hassleriana]|uniref:uncharacterized protein LOC104825007 n=1 Tax=Tarenaya hassleriana TaxID=28532 RepID=UPI0008FD607E|nr:PREDICTED: uncharacterized protein LOC104825007 [Tarenaya hassleriana]